MHYYWKTDHASELTDEVLRLNKELFADCPVPGIEFGFLHIGGALNDHHDDDGAVGNRDSRYMIGVNGMWEPDEPRADEFRQWIRAAWTRLHPHSTGATYINFQTADDGKDRIRASYGANFDRLRALKQQYDPSNLFRVNRNIPPAEERR